MQYPLFSILMMKIMKSVFFFPCAVTLVMMTALPSWSAASDVQTAPSHTMAVASPEYMLSRHTLHMGTLVSVKVFAKTPEDVKRLAAYLDDEVAVYEDMLSVHKSTPLNEVNRRAGEAVEVPEEVAQMSQQALEIASETDGMFEPMIGPVVNLWKIGFEGAHVPSEADIAHAVEKVDRSQVRIWQENDRWFMRIGVGQSIDMGAIAKGYIGTRLAEKLQQQGMTRGILDLGGNVVTIGSRAEGEPWKIGIQHPSQERGGYFAVVRAADESVVTSGAYERYFEENGRRYSHILDPKTGRPAKTDIASVTIIHRDGARADALCTALFAMGWDRASDFLRSRPDLKAIVMHADMTTIVMTPPAASVVTPADSSVKLTVLK